MTKTDHHRNRTTPKQRAEEQLGIANRRVIKADKLIDRLTADLAAARREHDDAIARRDYVAQDPALKGTSTTTTGDTTA